MENKIHSYHIPTEIIFGAGSTEKIGSKIKECNNPIIITDKVIKQVGLLDGIVGSLESSSLNADVYELPSAEPTVKSIQDAMDVVRQKSYDVVIGVGGGSVMDTAKIGAHGATTPGDLEDFLSGKVTLQRGLPTIMVPTTSGTGSEISYGAVITLEKGYKTGLGVDYPGVAIVDPMMTLSLPPRLTAGCAMDALSHAIEPMISKDHFNPVRDAYTLESVRLVFKYLRRAYYDGRDLAARANLAIAATMAGISMCISNSGWPAHCFAEVFGPIHKIPHGVGCALALPYMMKYNLPVCIDELSRLASAMGEKTEGLSKRKAAAKSIEAIVKLMEDVDLPLSLKAFNVPESDLPKMAEFVEKDYKYIEPSMMEFTARQLTGESIRGLFQDMWEGSL